MLGNRLLESLFVWASSMTLLLLSGFAETSGYLYSTIVNESALAAPCLVYLAVRRDVLSSMLRSLWNIRMRHSVLMALTVWVLGYFLTYVQDLFMPPPSWYVEKMKSLAPTNYVDFILALLLTWLLVAPAEELLFRWVLLNPMVGSLGVRMGAISSAVIFSFSHLDPWNIVSPFVMGLVAGLMVATSRSILSAIFIHGVHNTISISLIYLSSLL
ncbi:MAG: CPBP family intramembrane glutamic endopeptidase [Nitrososphaerota archaeon]